MPEAQMTKERGSAQADVAAVDDQRSVHEQTDDNRECAAAAADSQLLQASTTARAVLASEPATTLDQHQPAEVRQVARKSLHNGYPTSGLEGLLDFARRVSVAN